MRRPALAACLLAIGLAVPFSPASPAGAAEAYVVTIKTVQGQYRAVITDPEAIQRAQMEIEGTGEAGVPVGTLAYGDGGVNHGHKWHVTDLTFADVTIELCDGTAKMVDRDIAYWVETVASFCPWTAEVTKLKPLK